MEKIDIKSEEEQAIIKLLQEKDEMIEELGNRLAKSFIHNIDVLSTIASVGERFYDGSHSRFVAEKSMQVAEELGMEDDDIYELKVAALLHDIGKLAFFDSGLYKHINEMSQLEFEQYKKHPEIGLHILKQNEDLVRVADIIHQHHEKLDGTGFPRNLKGDAILPSAKVLIVVDFYHNSIYKKPVSRGNRPVSSVKNSNTASLIDSTQVKYNYTLNYLHKKRGILFEKKVVDVLIDIVQAERNSLGHKAVMRVPVNKIEPGMVFAEDYYTKFGILIAAKGETVHKDQVNALVRFAENDQIPMKILVLK